jgi:hypothetical protein
MPNLPLPIRPGANNTVPFGLPIAIGGAVVPLHQGVANLTEAIDLWVAGAGQGGQVTLSFTGTAATIVVNLPSGAELPSQVLDGVPVRGLTISGVGGFLGAGAAFGNVARNTPRRPLQPVRTASPSGAPVNLAGVGTPVTLHALEPDYADEIHLWVHNPTAVPLSDIVVGVAPVTPGVPAFCNQSSIAAYTTVKVLDGVVLRGNSTAATSLFAEGDAGHVLFGYFVRY